MAEDKKNPQPVLTAQEEEKAKIVRVAPYPIEGNLIKAEGQPPVPCKIARVEEIGLIFKAVKYLFRPGEEFKCSFEIPTLKTKVFETIKIIKTYENMEAYVPKGNKERVMTVEAHFKSPPLEVRQAIRKFTAKIGQKK